MIIINKILDEKKNMSKNGSLSTQEQKKTMEYIENFFVPPALGHPAYNDNFEEQLRPEIELNELKIKLEMLERKAAVGAVDIRDQEQAQDNLYEHILNVADMFLDSKSETILELGFRITTLAVIKGRQAEKAQKMLSSKWDALLTSYRSMEAEQPRTRIEAAMLSVMIAALFPTESRGSYEWHLAAINLLRDLQKNDDTGSRGYINVLSKLAHKSQISEPEYGQTIENLVVVSYVDVRNAIESKAEFSGKNFKGGAFDLRDSLHSLDISVIGNTPPASELYQVAKRGVFDYWIFYSSFYGPEKTRHTLQRYADNMRKENPSATALAIADLFEEVAMSFAKSAPFRVYAPQAGRLHYPHK